MNSELMLLPPWAVMWLLAGGLFAVGKVASTLVLWRLDQRPASALTFAILWPGMNPKEWVQKTNRETVTIRYPAKLAAGIVWLGAGLALLLISPTIKSTYWAGLCVMTALIGILHLGLFEILAWIWQKRGRPVRAVMRAPWRSRRLAEFWGERWNRAFRDLAYTWVFLPCNQRLGPYRAAWVVFVVSGLAHELVISVPAQGGYGGPLVYFLIQGVGCAWERHRGQQKQSRLLTAAFVLLPMPCLFHPPFVSRVMLPFAEWLHAFL